MGMLVAHATWHGGALCLWAEDPALPPTTRIRTSPKPHPFAAADFAGTSYAGPTAGAMRVALPLLLPGTATAPSPHRSWRASRRRGGPSRIRGGCPRSRSTRSPRWPCWPRRARPKTSYAAPTCGSSRSSPTRRCTSPGRGRVLPALVREDGDLTARWRPVITGDDAERFRELARAMPPACRAAGEVPGRPRCCSTR